MPRKKLTRRYCQLYKYIPSTGANIENTYINKKHRNFLRSREYYFYMLRLLSYSRVPMRTTLIYYATFCIGDALGIPSAGSTYKVQYTRIPTSNTKLHLWGDTYFGSEPDAKVGYARPIYTTYATRIINKNGKPVKEKQAS